MKAVILAAGKGTRMLPLTEEVPKVLVEVNGKPFLYYVLKSLQKAGYGQFCLVVGYKREKIQEFLEKFGFEAEMVVQHEQLGTGHALMQAREFVGGEDFILLAGDNLLDVQDFSGINQEDEFNYICGVRVEDPSKYGSMIVENEFLKEIKEKSLEVVSNIINTGLYKFKQEIFTALDKVEVSPRGEIELTDAVSILANEGKVKVVDAMWWIDLGCKEDVEKISAFLRENWKE